MSENQEASGGVERRIIDNINVYAIHVLPASILIMQPKYELHATWRRNREVLKSFYREIKGSTENV
jgi:hypothetical protein